MENKETDIGWKELSPVKKLRYLMGNIVIEPILICYIIPMMLSGMAVRNLNLEKACRVNLAYNDTVCDALIRRDTDNLQEQDDKVHILVTEMAIWKMPLQSAIPAVLIVFLGSWSDRRARRKPCLVLPVIGQIFTSIGLILCWYYYYEWPLEAAGLIEAILPSITGGGMVLVMAALSYVADITSVETRTFRIGVVNLLVGLGAPVGTALSGVLLEPLGYAGMFALTGVMYVMGFAYGMIRLKEARPTIPRPPNVGFLCDLFDPRHVRDTIAVALKRREGNRRLRILMLIVLSISLLGPAIGESETSYAYVRRQFHWNEVDYSYYSTYNIIITIFGTFLAIAVLSRRLGMTDSMIGLIGCVSHVIANFIYSFSKNPWLFYLGPVVEVVGGAGQIVTRSLASKLVLPEEVGKMNSLLGLFEALAPIIYSPIFSMVYTSTINTMPGTFYLLGSALTVPSICIFTWLYLWDRKDAAEQEKARVQETTKEKFQYSTPADYRVGPIVNEAFEHDKF